MTIELNIEWFKDLNEEQQKALLYAIFHYHQGRVVTMPLELQRLYYSIQTEIDNKKILSEKRRNAVNKRWHKNTNDTNVSFVSTNPHFVYTKPQLVNTNQQLVNTNPHFVDTKPNLYSSSDSQPLTPSIPSPARPRVDNNPSNCMLPTDNTSITINNIIYNIDIDTANNISTYIDAYKGNANKQSIVDIVCQLLKSQQWLALPLLPEIISHLLVADENPSTAPDCYSSVECRLIQAYAQANKNIETLRLMLIQSISRGWKIIKPVEHGPQNSNISSAADQDRQRRHAIIEAVYDRYKEQ